jgi:methionine synthase II (cobalamin-independent)
MSNKHAKPQFKDFDKIADKVKTKISKLLMQQFKDLEKQGKDIITIDEQDKTISLDYLRDHIYQKLKKGDIEVNVTDLEKGRFQITLPHIETTEFDHLYILPEIRENVLNNLSLKEKHILEALDLLRIRAQEEKNMNLSKQFAFYDVSGVSNHARKIAEIDEQLKKLI